VLTLLLRAMLFLLWPQQCTTDTCLANNTCSNSLMTAGTTCSSGYCTGSFPAACMECTADAHCDDGYECTTDTCLANNTCSHSFVPQHTNCSVGTCNGAGACDDGDLPAATLEALTQADAESMVVQGACNESGKVVCFVADAGDATPTATTLAASPTASSAAVTRDVAWNITILTSGDGSKRAHCFCEDSGGLQGDVTTSATQAFDGTGPTVANVTATLVSVGDSTSVVSVHGVSSEKGSVHVLVLASSERPPRVTMVGMQGVAAAVSPTALTFAADVTVSLVTGSVRVFVVGRDGFGNNSTDVAAAATVVVLSPTCDDGVANGQESDVDCGVADGAGCALCESGRVCLSSANCEAGTLCTTTAAGSGVCTPPAVAEAGFFVSMTVTLAGDVAAQDVTRGARTALINQFAAQANVSSADVLVTSVSTVVGGSGGVALALKVAVPSLSAAAHAETALTTFTAMSNGTSPLLSALSTAEPTLASRISSSSSSDVSSAYQVASSLSEYGATSDDSNNDSGDGDQTVLFIALGAVAAIVVGALVAWMVMSCKSGGGKTRNSQPKVSPSLKA